MKKHLLVLPLFTFLFSFHPAPEKGTYLPVSRLTVELPAGWRPFTDWVKDPNSWQRDDFGVEYTSQKLIPADAFAYLPEKTNIPPIVVHLHPQACDARVPYDKLLQSGMPLSFRAPAGWADWNSNGGYGEPEIWVATSCRPGRLPLRVLVQWQSKGNYKNNISYHLEKLLKALEQAADKPVASTWSGSTLPLTVAGVSLPVSSSWNVIAAISQHPQLDTMDSLVVQTAPGSGKVAAILSIGSADCEWLGKFSGFQKDQPKPKWFPAIDFRIHASPDGNQFIACRKNDPNNLFYFIQTDVSATDKNRAAVKEIISATEKAMNNSPGGKDFFPGVDASGTLQMNLSEGWQWRPNAHDFFPFADDVLQGNLVQTTPRRPRRFATVQLHKRCSEVKEENIRKKAELNVTGLEAWYMPYSSRWQIRRSLNGKCAELMLHNATNPPDAKAMVLIRNFASAR